MTELQKNYLEMLKEEEKEELANNVDTISSFKNFMAQKGVELADENFKYFQSIGIVATFPNIVSHLHPNLVNDKEGLLDFKNCAKLLRENVFLMAIYFVTILCSWLTLILDEGFKE